MNILPQLKDLISGMLEKKASDLILTEGQPPLIRVEGRISKEQAMLFTTRQKARGIDVQGSSLYTDDGDAKYYDLMPGFAYPNDLKTTQAVQNSWLEDPQ